MLQCIPLEQEVLDVGKVKEDIVERDRWDWEAFKRSIEKSGRVKTSWNL